MDADRTAENREQARIRQRRRRSTLRRIDYQNVSEEAAAIIDAELRPCGGGDYSSVINRIVEEWGRRSRRRDRN